jgi:hypothetical protein
MTFDPRTMGTPVYEALKKLRGNLGKDTPLVKEQKSQAVELYVYLSTWGMMRLKAEEKALNKEGKKQVIKQYFDCLEQITEIRGLSTDQGLKVLLDLSTNEYLGLTGLGLAIAQEFSFWAAAIYHDVKGAE